MCDLHQDCKECIKQGLDKVFTLDHWKMQCQKMEDVANYERTKSKDWQNLVKRQSASLAEKDLRITSLENTQGMLERQLRKANAQIEKSRSAYAVQCAETMRWKQHLKDLKHEHSAQSQVIQQIVRDAQQIEGMQAILDRSVVVDPTLDLMSLFDIAANEYEAGRQSALDEEVV
jgi:hypothetical protein